MTSPARTMHSSRDRRLASFRGLLIALSCLVAVCLSSGGPNRAGPGQPPILVEPGAGVDQAAVFADAIAALQRLRESHRLTEAETEAKRLLAAAVEEFGADSPQTIEVSGLLVHTLMQIGKRRVPEAIRYAESSLASAERIYPPADLRLTTPIEDLASAVDYFGSFEEGKLLYERSLRIKEAALGPYDFSVAQTLANLSASYAQLGDHAGRRLTLERALAVYQKIGPEDYRSAGVLFPLAGACASEGDLEAAVSFAQRAVRLMDKTPPSNQSPLLGLSLAALGNVLFQDGQYDESYRAFDRAHRMWLKTLGPEDGNVAWMLSAKSLVLSAKGQHAEARSAAQAGLTIHQKEVGPEDRTLVMYLKNLATVLINAGDDRGAEPLLSRAVRLRERAYGSDHPGVRAQLDDLARVQYRLRQYAAALDNALRSESIGREDFQDRARILSERHIYQFEASRISSLQVALSVLDRQAAAPTSDQVEKVWDEVVRSRALVLDELTLRQRTAMNDEGPEVTALLQEIRMLKARLAGFALQKADPASGVTIEGMADAQVRKERAEQELARRSAEHRKRAASREVGLVSVRKALPPDSALVSFVEYERLAPVGRETAAGATASAAGRHYAAFLLTGASDRASFVYLGTKDEIESLVGRWQKSAGEGPPPMENRLGASETRYRNAGTELRRKIWDPVARALAGRRIAFVVPDGALHLINLATLPVGEETYLLETGPLVHYLSAERDLALQTRKQYARSGALILGGPDPDADPAAALSATIVADARFSGGPDVPITGPRTTHRSQPAECKDFRSTRFEPLPGAMAEADEVRSQWSGSAGVVELTGSSATEASFKLLAPGRRLLHMAMHGFFLQDRCASAFPGPNAPSIPPKRTGAVLPRAVGDSPLLLSGLILAGANRRAETMKTGQGEDGILTAEEVGSMDLSGVEWAVLSACETGIGRVRAGEGILGLRRAFEVAGAGTLITSLWRVDDEATRLWMRNLYRARLGGRSTIESVHDASISMLKESRSRRRSTHPFYWGGFVAAGDWR